MKRTLTIIGAAIALTVSGAAPLAAQASRTLLDSLEAARKQRMALEAQLEQQLATGIAERAKNLAMSNEAGALQRLEVLLDSAQARLLVQRDRIRLLADAATQTHKAVLVILLRADVVPDGEVATVLRLDGTPQAVVTFTPERARALAAGAADELFRAEIAPVEHTVVLNVSARGLSVSETVTFPVNARDVRYVEFALRGGRLVPTTWTSRSAAP